MHRSRIDVQRWRLLHRLVVVGALVAACAMAAFVVVAPVERLILIVPDDAFYYLQIARNLLATGRSTADGFSATNGYHPLWLAVVTSLAAVFRDRELLLRATVATSFLMHVVASSLVGVRVTQVVGLAWGRTAGLCWLLNRVAFLIALQAMESSLYIVLLLVALGVHLRIAARLRDPITNVSGRLAGEFPLPRGLLALYGVSLGLAFLARTEGAVVAAVAFAWLGVRLWRSSVRRREVAVSWGLSAAAALVIVLPWLLFSLWQVGTIQQDSGAMKVLWAGDLYPDGASRVGNLLATADYFLRGSVRLMWYSQPLGLRTLVPLAAAAAVVGAQVHRPRGRVAMAIRAVVVSATGICVVYGLTLVDRQIWWLALPWLAMFLAGMLGTVWLCRAIPAARRRQGVVRGGLVAAWMISFIALARSPLTPYAWQADVLRSQAVIERQIPRDQRIGCFNAGIPLYFGTGRVVALDGLVSHAARGYWFERRVGDYVRAAHVRFIADDRLTLERAQRFSGGGAPIAVEERDSFPLRGWPTGERTLWVVGPLEASAR